MKPGAGGGWTATVRRRVGCALGGCLAVSGVVSAAACSSGEDRTPGEPLAALIGEDGKFDCRRIYTHVPLQTYLSADLSAVDARAGMSEASPVEGEAGSVNCPVPYRVGETGGLTAPFFIRSIRDADAPALKTVTGIYKEWTTGTMMLSGDGDDGPGKLAAAVLDTPGHGVLVVFTPVDVETTYPRTSLGEAAPDAVRTVIDGLEGAGGPAVPEGSDADRPFSLFTTDGRFDCTAVYQRVSVTTAETTGIRLPVKTSTNPVIRESGDRTSCALSVGDPLDTTAAAGTVPQTEVTTGPGDGLRGGPVTGSPDLVGWEEYWNFDGADHPVVADAEGQESYNARYCRSDSDCITVTAYPKIDVWSGSSPQAMKDAVLPLVRLVAEHENLLTDGEEQ